MNFPPAPVSSRAFVSTFFFPFCSLESRIGIVIDLFSISATITFKMEIKGVTVVNTGSFFKNPSQQSTSPSILSFVRWSYFWCSYEHPSVCRSFVVVSVAFVEIPDFSRGNLWTYVPSFCIWSRHQFSSRQPHTLTQPNLHPQQGVGVTVGGCRGLQGSCRSEYLHRFDRNCNTNTLYYLWILSQSNSSSPSSSSACNSGKMTTAFTSTSFT